MRFGRSLLAGLAPLLGLSALVAAMAAAQGAPSARFPVEKSFASLWLQSVVHLVGPTAEFSSKHAPSRPSAHSVFALAALAATPLRHSLWMVARPAVPHPDQRRIPHPPLRC